MPKNTTQKDNKGKKTTKASKNTKAVTSKKVPTKKVETKKIDKIVEVEEVVETKKGNVKKANTSLNTLVTKTMNNTPFVIALCVIIVLLAGLIFMLCFKRVPKTSKGNEIIATINGKTITADELYETLKEDHGTDSLINLIDTYIANKEIEITEENKEYVQETVDYYKEYAEYYGVDLATFLANYVGLNGITTEEEFYDFVLEDYKKTLVVTNFIANEASEDDLKKHYEENYSDKLTVKHILIEVDAEAEDADEADAEAKKKAKQLIKELNNTSAEDLDKVFEELVEDNSDDTANYSSGGLIVEFSKKDVVEEFWEASYDLKDGEYTSKPVKTTYGYHVILKVSSTPVEKYEDIKDDVKTSYAENLLSEDTTLSVTKWDEIRSQYKMSIKDDIIKKAYETKIEEAKKTEE